MPTVVPTVSTDLIGNPGIGLQSFYRTKNNDPNSANFPIGSAYWRYYWSEFEPTQGDFSFTPMVNDYNAARAQGQDYCTRVSPYDDSAGGPAWLRALGVSGYTYIDTTSGSGATLWAPNQDDATVKSIYATMIQALGSRFDGLPGFGPIDIGSIGLWGEWHNYSAIIQTIIGGAPGTVGQQIPMPPLATCKWYVDQFFAYFPKTMKIMGSGETTDPTKSTLAYALSLGAGWRGDSLDDPGHDSVYLTVLPGGTNDTHWQGAPVYYEVASYLSSLSSSNLTTTVDFVLQSHASVVEDKQDTISSAAISEVTRMLNSLGYRIVLNSLTYPASAVSGQQITIATNWSNAGVAPSYLGHVVAIQIRSSSGAAIVTSNTGISIKNFLPGTSYPETSVVNLPTGMSSGTYMIAIGVVDPTTMHPVVRLGITGADANGWYPLATLSISAMATSVHLSTFNAAMPNMILTEGGSVIANAVHSTLNSEVMNTTII